MTADLCKGWTVSHKMLQARRCSVSRKHGVMWDAGACVDCLTLKMKRNIIHPLAGGLRCRQTFHCPLYLGIFLVRLPLHCILGIYREIEYRLLWKCKVERSFICFR